VKILTLAQAADTSGLSAAWLRRMAQMGRLKGTKAGKTWLVTPAALAAFLATERHPGRPSK